MAGEQECIVVSTGGDQELQRALQSLASYLSSADRSLDELRAQVASLARSPEPLEALPLIAATLEGLVRDSQAFGFAQISAAAQKMQQLVLDLVTGARTWQPDTAALLTHMSESLAVLVFDFEGSDQDARVLDDLIQSVSPPEDSVPSNPS